MAQVNVLPQETIEVDGIPYHVTAMSASDGLQFMEKHMESLDSGKQDLSLIKKTIVKYVCHEGKQFTEKSFDIIFARRLLHLQKLFQAILKYNFEDVFTEPAGEEEA